MIQKAKVPAIGLDLDGTIDQAPEFFSHLSSCWQGEVHIITYRTDRQGVVRDLERHGIKSTHIHLVDSFEAKAKIASQHHILMMFDDMPEVLKSFDQNQNVCLIRNEGNYDYETRRWQFSHKTGEIVQ
jgi:hypothetical protein